MHTFEGKPKAPHWTASPKSPTPGRAHLGHCSDANLILYLQRTIGNHAVQRVLQAKLNDFEAVSDATASSLFGGDFYRTPMHAQASVIQSKLAVNTPGDLFEEEADRVADQVMSMPEARIGTDQPSHNPVRIQNKLGSLGRAEPIETPPIVSEALASSGQPLDQVTLESMESRFSEDFSPVRVHTDAKTAESARAIGALAYTVGHDIHFAAGQYRPDSDAGYRLIAHELVHHIQQKGSAMSPARNVQRAPDDKGGDKGPGGPTGPFPEEAEVISYAVGARELGKLAQGFVLRKTKTWNAIGMADSAFYVGPFSSDMGNIYYVYRFTGSDEKTSTYTLSQGVHLGGWKEDKPGELQAALALVKGARSLKVSTTGVIPPAGGVVEKPTKQGAEPTGAEKKTAGEGKTKPEADENPEVLTPQRKKWLTAGRENMKHEILSLFNEIQKVKATRIDTWEKNANIKDPKPVRAALEVAIEVVGYGMGGVVGGYLTKAMAHGIAQEFMKDALLKSTAKLAEYIFDHAVEPAEKFMAEETGKAVKEDKDSNAAGALATKSNLLDCYVEAMKLQSMSEQRIQTREFNATVDKNYTELALADTVLVYERVHDELFHDPKSFLRELSGGLIRLKDEMYTEERAKKYGGDVAKTMREDPTIHETEERSGNLLLVVAGGANELGKWSSPTFNFDGFIGLSSGVNKATLAELAGTPVKDLPFTLGFRFWALNPFSGLFVDPLCQVWFEHRQIDEIWVNFDEPRNEDGVEWLASYYLLTSRELSKEERRKNAPSGARKVYERIKDKPVLRLENMDIL